MLDAKLVGEEFDAALGYHDYVATGSDEQRRRWAQVYDVANLTPAQGDLVASFTREMKVLVVSGIWCGDCVQQCPLVQRIGDANPGKVRIRYVDRDEHKDLS